MLKRLFALVVLLALVAVALHHSRMLPTGFLPGDLGAVGERLEDARVTASVKAALRLNRLTRDAPVEVASENGVVTLRGQVPGEAAREAATRLAGAVPDVRQVVSHLAIVPSVPPPEGRSLGESLDDRALEVEVRLALKLRRELAGSDVEVTAFRRAVTLGGVVPTEAARLIAVETARDTAGVEGVEDGLRVAGEGPRDRPPPGGRQAAERALRENRHLARYSLEVGEEGGRLVLRGRVATGAEKDLAGLLARDAAGGPVENALQIRP